MKRRAKPHRIGRFLRSLIYRMPRKPKILPMSSGSLHERVLKFQFATNKTWGR